MTKKILTCLIVVFSSIASAQQGTSSPYSFYGIGSLKFKGTAENRAMGGISVYSDSIHVNLKNPASYAGSNFSFYNNEARPVKFAIGTSFSSTTLKTASDSDESGTSSVDYLAVVLPLQKFGVGFGIMPYTNVGYKLQSKNDEGILENRYRGEGGVNRVFLGVGYQLLESLKVGLDAQYNFGNISNTSIAFGYNDQGDLLQYQSRISKRSDLSGFSFSLGMVYQKSLGNRMELMAAASYSPKANLNSNNQSDLATISIDVNGQEYTINTIENNLEDQNLLETTMTLPAKTTLGIGIGRPLKWFVGLDYTFLEASNFSNRFINVDNTTFENASSLSFGGFFIPKYDSFSNYWKRIVYRAGIRYEQTGLVVNNESIKEFGISFGVGVPVGRLFSNANVAFEFGQRGTTASELVEENFFNLNISLSLNDRWFEKRKFN